MPRVHPFNGSLRCSRGRGWGAWGSDGERSRDSQRMVCNTVCAAGSVASAWGRGGRRRRVIRRSVVSPESDGTDSVTGLVASAFSRVRRTRAKRMHNTRIIVDLSRSVWSVRWAHVHTGDRLSAAILRRAGCVMPASNGLCEILMATKRRSRSRDMPLRRPFRRLPKSNGFCVITPIAPPA